MNATAGAVVGRARGEESPLRARVRPVVMDRFAEGCRKLSSG